MRLLVRAAIVLLVALIFGVPSEAAWPHSPYTNLIVCGQSAQQTYSRVAPDGQGGAIVAWRDSRDGNYGIYTQHVLAAGSVDSAWPVNGRALCGATAFQYAPQLVSDGSGGAIVTWQDTRNGNYDIYAQHVLASGSVDPSWPTNGRAICTAAYAQESMQIVADGAGGAIITWHDYRSGAGYDIYAQRVLASGSVDPAWPVDGRALCTASGNQYEPQIVSDDAGGAIVAWADYRTGNWDVYAQRVLDSGVADPAWPVDGRAVSTAASTQNGVAVASDGQGGAFIAWEDYRSGADFDIYAQHLLASGSTEWYSGGSAVCTATGAQQSPQLVSDGSGGVVLAWEDYRSGSGLDIYAHHVPGSGIVDSSWPADGRALCTATGNQTDINMAADGEGGATVAWEDSRGSLGEDVYAQHVLAAGTVDPAWPADGRAVCAASGTQYRPQILADGAGGVIISWDDSRTATSDIMAQRIGRHGYLGTPEPEIVSVYDVPDDEGGLVKVSWTASYLDLQSNAELDYYDVLRSVPPNLAASRLARGLQPRTLGPARTEWRPGDLVVETTGAQTYYWEYLAAVPARHYLSGYSYLASTSGDSVASGNPGTEFMVVGRNNTLSMWWPSTPMSGYSVDNLAPAAPALLTGDFGAGVVHLHWDPNLEPDLAGYRLYRGAAPDFVPGPATLVVAQPDTGYADPITAPYHYKLTAMDVHGNESGVATLSPQAIVGVTGGAAPRLLFAGPAPNPMSTLTALRYVLPRDSHVRLAIYDATGRGVRELVDGAVTAGDHAASWDRRDTGGRLVGAGVYFARLEIPGALLVRRVAVTQ